MPLQENNNILDKWAAWLLVHRFGGNEQVMQATMEVLGKIRDHILEGAGIQSGNTVLDIGTGDGLIGIKALEMAGEKGEVIFSDISQDALDYCKSIVVGLQGAKFLKLSATHLEGIPDESIDRVVSRAVLIYIEDKNSSFKESYRVLKKGGILSISEPVSQFSLEFSVDGYFWGYDCNPIKNIISKIDEIYGRNRTASDNPMTNFNERDLLKMAVKTGFTNVQIELQGGVFNNARHTNWEALLKQAPNPLVPTLSEILQQVLNETERTEFETYLRPKVENEPARFITANAYLIAEK